MGVGEDRVRLELSRAALVDGRELTRLEEAVAVGAGAAGIEAGLLRDAALSSAVRETIEDSTRLFHSL